MPILGEPSYRTTLVDLIKPEGLMNLGEDKLLRHFVSQGRLVNATITLQVVLDGLSLGPVRQLPLDPLGLLPREFDFLLHLLPDSRNTKELCWFVVFEVLYQCSLEGIRVRKAAGPGL